MYVNISIKDIEKFEVEAAFNKKGKLVRKMKKEDKKFKKEKNIKHETIRYN
jgi:hypothetical protein